MTKFGLMNRCMHSIHVNNFLRCKGCKGYKEVYNNYIAYSAYQKTESRLCSINKESHTPTSTQLF